jgi:hypothetical protein
MAAPVYAGPCMGGLAKEAWRHRSPLAASGVAIRKLRTEYQVTSHVTRGANRSVRLAGARDSVDVASAYLQGYGTVISQKLPLEDEELGLLIGKKGVTIAQLQEKTNCSFVVDKKNSTVAVLGLAEEVEGAAAEVRAHSSRAHRVSAPRAPRPATDDDPLRPGGPPPPAPPAAAAPRCVRSSKSASASR